MIALIGAMLTVSMALAAVPQGTDNTALVDEGDYDFGTIGTADVTSGHVYYSDLNTNVSSFKWAGLYGNVSGNIVLSDDDQDILYHWAANGRVVYATEAGTPDWTSMSDALRADVVGDYAHIDTADKDNYSNTFVGGVENIGSALYVTLDSDFAQTYDASESVSWKTYSVQDAVGNLVFAGLVQEGGAESYKGTTVDYQMILPEDGTAGDLTATTYNLFAELQ